MAGKHLSLADQNLHFLSQEIQAKIKPFENFKGSISENLKNYVTVVLKKHQGDNVDVQPYSLKLAKALIEYHFDEKNLENQIAPLLFQSPFAPQVDNNGARLLRLAYLKNRPSIIPLLLEKGFYLEDEDYPFLGNQLARSSFEDNHSIPKAAPLVLLQYPQAIWAPLMERAFSDPNLSFPKALDVWLNLKHPEDEVMKDLCCLSLGLLPSHLDQMTLEETLNQCLSVKTPLELGLRRLLELDWIESEKVKQYMDKANQTSPLLLSFIEKLELDQMSPSSLPAPRTYRL